MKVVIFASLYGGCPDALKGKIRPRIRDRVGSIVSYIENTSIPHNVCVHDDEWYKNNKDVLTSCGLSNKEIYFGYCSELERVTAVHIVDVDTTRKWYIRVVDGQEIVTYIPEFKCIDEGLNYYEKSY